jgi:hypothetical protein
MPTLIKNGVPDKMQFAYQKGKSCVHASFVLQESIHHTVRERKQSVCMRGVNYSKKSVRRFLGLENPGNFSRDSGIFSPNLRDFEIFFS